MRASGEAAPKCRRYHLLTLVLVEPVVCEEGRRLVKAVSVCFMVK
jgi:hypothetical protein